MPRRPPPPEEAIARNGGIVIACAGEDGKTAPEAHKICARALKSGASDLGELVETINGIGNGNGYYLINYVNCSMAKTGAGNYLMKSGDRIEWKLIAPRKNS